MHCSTAAARCASLALLVALSACSESEAPATGSKKGDASRQPDAKTGIDVGPVADAGVAGDASVAADGADVTSAEETTAYLDAASDAPDAKAAGADAETKDGPDGDPSPDVPASYDQPPAELGAPAQLFDPFGVHAVHITVDPANWAAYLDGVNKPDGKKVYDWYVATVSIDDVAFPNIGIRGYGNGSQITNPEKPNIRLKFDQFSFAGIGPAGEQSLRLKSAGQDATFLREPIAYELVRSVGGYAPRWSWALVTVNGVNYGIYQLIESVDKRLFKAVFGNNDGHKYESTIGCIGLNCPWGDCKKIPKAYKLDPGDGSELVALATAITTVTDEQFEVTVGGIINLDGLLAAYANDAVLSNIDGLASSGQNFTFYVNEATGKIEIIQTGMDLTFGNFGDAWYDFLAPWGPPNSWCPGRIDWMFKRITQIPALKDKLLAKMRALQCGAFGAGKLVPVLAAYQELLNKFVYKDPLSPYSADKLDQKYESLSEYVTLRTDALKVLLGPCP